MQSIIEVEKVTKTIKGRLVLKDVSLQVPAGQIYGISGPNGSGKSMLLRVICGLVIPQSGRVEVFGYRIGTEKEFPPETGALIETPGFLPGYSGMDNLLFLAMIRNQITRDEIAEVIRLVGLDPDDPRPVRVYSTGMRQRLGLAQAIMEKPKLLILDEPTNGLDRQGVADIHALLMQLNQKGVTILLTSHSTEELQSLCGKTYWMENGILQAERE
ncbi:MAG: ABC transporter ATP-binding protein [Chloroflexota bacterium]|nr:ABC transporter ATP-binding protein [Chloroflexota bacterium]MBI5703110.1 ABC transporter ATP-binding protein [Chloroflexota bacterium]